MAKHYSLKEREKPPSLRHYARHMSVPPGCLDLWRINVADGGSVIIHSQWLNRDLAMDKADSVWRDIATRNVKWAHVYVEHKAAIRLGEKLHVINIPSFKPADAPNTETSLQGKMENDPDYQRWLAEFEETKA